MTYLVYLFIILALLALFIVYYQYNPIRRLKNMNISEIKNLSRDLKRIHPESDAEMLVRTLVGGKIAGLAINRYEIIAYFRINNQLNRFFAALRLSEGAELEMTPKDLTNFASAGGNPESLVKAMLLAQNYEIDLPYKHFEFHALNEQNVEELIDIAIKAKPLNMNFHYFIANSLTNNEIRRITNVLMKAHKAGLFITTRELNELDKNSEEFKQKSLYITPKEIVEIHRERDIDNYVHLRIKAHHAGILLNIKTIKSIALYDDSTFEGLVNALIRSKKKNVDIDFDEYIHYSMSGVNIINLINAQTMIISENLDIELIELINHHQLGGDFYKLVGALSLAKSKNLSLTKDELLSKYFDGADLLTFVKAKALFLQSNFETQMGVKFDAVETIFKSKGNVLDVLNAVINAKNANLNLPFAVAAKIDSLHAQNIANNINYAELTDFRKKICFDSAFKWAFNPEVYEVVPKMTIVTRQGIQVVPKVNVTLLGKMEKYLSGTGKELIFSRINEVLIDEIENYISHEDVLLSLNKISKNILERIKNEIDYTDDCAYNVMDINISDISIGHDATLQLQVDQAQMKAQIHEYEAQIRMSEAEAEIRQAMADAYKTGKITNFNELHKDEIMKSTPPSVHYKSE